jgi:hypothetical protein
MHVGKLSLSCLQTSLKDHCNTAPVTRTYELFLGAASSRSLSDREGDIGERSQSLAGVPGILERNAVQDCLCGVCVLVATEFVPLVLF